MAGPPARHAQMDPHGSAGCQKQDGRRRKKTLDAEKEPDDYTRRVAEWEKDSTLQSAVDSFDERMGPIMQAMGDRDDRADIANRLKRGRSAKRQKKLGLVSGDRVLPKNTQVAASTTVPFAPEMYEVTQVVGALLRIGRVEAGKVKTVHSEN